MGRRARISARLAALALSFWTPAQALALTVSPSSLGVVSQPTGAVRLELHGSSSRRQAFEIRVLERSMVGGAPVVAPVGPSEFFASPPQLVLGPAERKSVELHWRLRRPNTAATRSFYVVVDQLPIDFGDAAATDALGVTILSSLSLPLHIGRVAAPSDVKINVDARTASLALANMSKHPLRLADVDLIITGEPSQAIPGLSLARRLGADALLPGQTFETTWTALGVSGRVVAAKLRLRE